MYIKGAIARSWPAWANFHFGRGFDFDILRAWKFNPIATYACVINCVGKNARDGLADVISYAKILTNQILLTRNRIAFTKSDWSKSRPANYVCMIC